MTFQARVREFLVQHDLRHAPHTHALDLTAEVGEVAKALLESSDYGWSPVRPDAALKEELGNVFFSLVALAESLGIDLRAALHSAPEKYEARLGSTGQTRSGGGGERESDNPSNSV
jgi:NTP pyrophosphatase (non-canonical NTP hydrolase)